MTFPHELASFQQNVLVLSATDTLLGAIYERLGEECGQESYQGWGKRP
jgi:hypothetical protein